jgi:hypothetical protein
VVTDWWLFLEDFVRTALVVGAAFGVGIAINAWFMRGN